MATFLLGLGFIAMEIHEFYGMIMSGNGPERSSFLSAFFTLVGTHGTHVSFGLVWMAVLMGQVTAKGVDRARPIPIDAAEHVLALSRYCVGGRIQCRLPDGGDLMPDEGDLMMASASMDSSGASRGSLRTYHPPPTPPPPPDLSFR